MRSGPPLLVLILAACTSRSGETVEDVPVEVANAETFLVWTAASAEPCAWKATTVWIDADGKERGRRDGLWLAAPERLLELRPSCGIGKETVDCGDGGMDERHYGARIVVAGDVVTGIDGDAISESAGQDFTTEEQGGGNFDTEVPFTSFEHMLVITRRAFWSDACGGNAHSTVERHEFVALGGTPHVDNQLSGLRSPQADRVAAAKRGCRECLDEIAGGDELHECDRATAETTRGLKIDVAARPVTVHERVGGTCPVGACCSDRGGPEIIEQVVPITALPPSLDALLQPPGPVRKRLGSGAYSGWTRVSPTTFTDAAAKMMK